MTVLKEKTSEDSYEDIIEQVKHETAEDCISYFSSNEHFNKTEGRIIQSFSLVKSTVNAKILGRALVVRGLPWKLFTVQNFKKGDIQYLYVSVVCDVITDAIGWSCNAKVELVLRNFKDEGESLFHTCEHIFSHQEPEHVCYNSIRMDEFYKSECPYVKDGVFEFQLSICADTPRGLSWNSRKIAGYVGIINLGATCYLNSLLQTLFFARPLLKIILQTPTETDHRSRSVVFALQYTFMGLFYSPIPIDTKRLGESFGWISTDYYIQHDVQEMCRILIDHVEEKTKGTRVDGEIAKLFRGTSMINIKCTDVPFESNKEENFYDLQLSVEDNGTINKAIEQYCAPETLDGDNKYFTDDYGRQKAIKRHTFVHLPHFLHCHLLRFLYNPLSGTYEKVCGRFEFYPQIDLSKYVQNTSADPNDNIYYLQSILAHHGNTNGGHYIAYVSPKCDSNWYKFDDDIVYKVSESEAIQGSYGSNEFRSTSGYTAYMLLYIKASTLKDPQYSFTEEDIPQYLRQIYKYHNNSMEIPQPYSSTCQMNIILDDILFSSHNTYTVDLQRVPSLDFILPDNYTVNNLIDYLADHLGVDKRSVRLWSIKANIHKMLMPSCITSQERELGIKNLSKNKCAIFVEQIDNEEEFDNNYDLMMFLHSFDKDEQKILYHGFYKIKKSKSLYESLQEIFIQLDMIFDNNSSVFLELGKFRVKRFEDIHEPIYKHLDYFYDTISIIVQSHCGWELNKGYIQYPFNNVQTYVEDLPNKYNISFYNVNSDCEEPSFSICASKRMPLRNLVQHASQRVDVDPKYFRLLKYKQLSNPCTVIRSSYDGTTFELFNSMNRTSDSQRLYFQVLRVPVVEVEDKAMFHMKYRNKKNVTTMIPIFIDVKNCSLKHLSECFYYTAIRYQLNILNPIRIVNTEKTVLSIVSTDSEILTKFKNSDYKHLRFEEIPDDQINLQDYERLISVNLKLHESLIFNLELSFFIKINPTQTYKYIANEIDKLVPSKIHSISLFYAEDSKCQSFPSDGDQVIPSSIFNSSQNIPSITKTNLINSATILVLIVNPNLPRRVLKQDISIRIHT